MYNVDIRPCLYGQVCWESQYALGESDRDGIFLAVSVKDMVSSGNVGRQFGN